MKCGIIADNPKSFMNLVTEYLGLRLNSPFVVGASPLCDDVAIARGVEDAGAAAIVMRSLFEEQLEPAPVRRSVAENWSSEASGRFPECSDYQLSPDQYLRQVEHLKSALSIPVIASLN